MYFNAAGTSILQDTVRAAPESGQVIDVTRQGDLTSRKLDALAANVHSVLGSASTVATPIRAVEFTGHLAGQPSLTATTLAWREDYCANLTITSGRCPTGAGEVLVGATLAKKVGIRLGQRIDDKLRDSAGNPIMLTVTGLYQVPNAYSTYWSGRPYFITLTGAGSDKGPSFTDGLFTPQSTFAGAASFSQGTDVVDLPLRLDTLSYAAAGPIDDLVNRLTAQVTDAEVATTIPTVLSAASTSQQALAAPVFLVTIQLLVLCWLLLFLLVTDAAEARGNEVALAKLRGLTRRQTVLFGLSEQVVLLIVALPVGALVGWLATKALADAILRAGTPVPLVGLGWAAAAAAVAGGAVAALGAARRTLSRSVLAQWSHTATDTPQRGWVMDAVIGVLAIAALVELFVSGVLGNANHNPLALLAPGLIGLTIALLSSRALPLLSKAFFSRTARQGGLGGFLAMRQVARRPGAARTTVALTTAFGLVTFTIAAWSVVTGNIHDVAWTEVGAAQVLDVVPPDGTQLNTIVDKLDPSGANAVTVERQTATDPNTNQVRTMLAVDPQRFAKVAYWRGDYAPGSFASLANQLDPPEPAPVLLTGDQMSVAVHANITGGASGAELYATVEGYLATGLTPVDLGSINGETDGTFTAQLPDCAPHPCQLRNLYLEPQNPTLDFSVVGAPFGGTFAINGIGEHDNAGWHPVNAGLGTAQNWQAVRTIGGTHKFTLAPGSLSDKFLQQNSYSGSQTNETLEPVDTPNVLPAIMTQSVLGGGGAKTADTYGLDDNISLTVRPVAIATALPGAGESGLIVDRDYAELAGTGTQVDVRTEVWLAPTAPADFAARLRAAGVSILSTTTATDTAGSYSRQGPALALALFLADAAAAAILAAGGAVLGMHLAGRRRSYEMAALVATGARKRSLGGGLIIEQVMTLGFGALFGIGAGLLAAVLAVPSIPEFVNLPFNGGAPLQYHPSASQLSMFLGIAVVLLAAAALASAGALIRSIRPEQLREAAP
ncbi:MAG TPA: FtsX-like permease family protein [Pseudonocardiaceae bacterium]|nr:FtsX-like permease family protein [Pseudonocardiaceae bacterium]